MTRCIKQFVGTIASGARNEPLNIILTSWSTNGLNHLFISRNPLPLARPNLKDGGQSMKSCKSLLGKSKQKSHQPMIGLSLIGVYLTKLNQLLKKLFQKNLPLTYTH